MAKKSVLFEFDICNINDLKDIMEKYGDSKHPYFATDEDGNNLIISIYPDCIITQTSYTDGLNKISISYKDGNVKELCR